MRLGSSPARYRPQIQNMRRCQVYPCINDYVFHCYVQATSILLKHCYFNIISTKTILKFINKSNKHRLHKSNKNSAIVFCTLNSLGSSWRAPLKIVQYFCMPTRVEILVGRRSGPDRKKWGPNLVQIWPLLILYFYK